MTDMNIRQLLRILPFLLLALVGTSCGGGGGGGSGEDVNLPPSPPAGSGTWGQMIWDQDNWG